MFRKLLAVAISLVAVGITASSVQAAQFNNPGMFGVSGSSWGVFAHIPGVGEINTFQCVNDWEMNTSANGHLDIHNLEMDEPAPTGDCDALNDCDDNGWEGQLTSTRTIHVDMCFEESGDFGGEVTCLVANGTAEIHCGHAMVSSQFGAVPVPLEIHGELSLSASLSISP